jgi:hypothetical protein
MKTFTRLSMFLTFALAWMMQANAQGTCDAPGVLECNTTLFGGTLGIANDNATSGAGTCLTTVGTGGQQWYTFTPSGDATVTITTDGAATDFDSKLHVYEGTCGALTCVTGDDDGGTGATSLVTFDAIGGVTYLVRVGGFGGAEGTFELSAECAFASDGCTNPAACNFSAAATNDDGSCCLDNCLTLELFDNFGDGWNGHTFQLTDVTSGLVVASATLTAGAEAVETFCLPDGCYLITWIDGAFDGEVTWILTGADEGEIGGGANPTGLIASLGETCILGCTDVTASNYNPAATIDDGGCLACPAGSLPISANLFDSFGDGWNGANMIITNTVTSTVVFQQTFTTGAAFSFQGCLDPGCYNVAVTNGAFPGEVSWELLDANGDVLFTGGAGDTFGFNWAGQTGCVIPGCTDAGCNNYNSFATEDDGSCICPPSNDDCANAAPIICGVSVDGTTENANDDIEAADCGGVPVTSPGVWYYFIGDGSQVNFSTCSSAGGDTKITVYQGTCGALNCVTGNDDGCPTGFLSSTTFTSVNGLAYYVLVSEFGVGNGIPFTLEMTCLECNDIPVNDDCTNALPIPQGVDFPGSLCCSNPDADMTEWDPFGTQYGIWYVVNSGDADAISVEFFNGLGDGADAEDGTDVGIGIFNGVDGCADLVPVIGGVGFDGTPLDGFVFDSYEFGITIDPNTNYYFCLSTSDPINCGSFVLNVTLSNTGCTDPSADNYDATASIDDGSCTYTTVPDNDLCANAEVLVCNTTISGSTALSTNTGSPNVCPDGAGDNGVWYTFVGDGSFVTLSTCGSTIDTRIMVVSAAACGGPYTCVVSENNDASDEGCGFFDDLNASVEFISEVGTNYFVYITAGAVDTDGDFVNDLFDGGFDLEFACAAVLEGCTDACACNFNADANVSDDSCDYFSCAGCGAGTAAVQMNMADTFGDGWNLNEYEITDLDGNVIAVGDLDNASCGDGTDAGFDIFCLEDGCYNITVGGGFFATEVSWSLVDETGTVIVEGGVETASFTIGNGVCGCTDAAACNFDPAATDDDGSCESLSCVGCLDPAACNFDATATIEGVCCNENCVTLIMNDSFGDGWNGNNASIVDNLTGTIVGTGTIPAGGSTATASFCLPNGCYTITVGGGTFPLEVSWILTGANGVVTGGVTTGIDFTVGAGASCEPGCLEPAACNYNPDAGISDCSLCEYTTCLGCTYEAASNFNANASIDDGSCLIQGSCPCPGDFNQDGVVSVADLIIFTDLYGIQYDSDCVPIN